MILNLTPHAINVLGADGTEHVFAPSGEIARVTVRTEAAEPLPGGIETGVPVYGNAELPASAQTADAVIVSTLFASAWREQNGAAGPVLLVPDSGPDAVRENGQIRAVRRFLRR